ncbi:MAG TPA: hypothetical protein VMB20_02735 [Candidatus Acidoferrum sp.]|nr:hypothetical protein [Candidatus Acidoferrum sp.]
MDNEETLSLATSIVREARAKAERADFETTVQEFERSEILSLRSLARVYRMLQWPPNL